MEYNELLEKRKELEFKIDKLNERLRFGSSGDISGINALSEMKKNLELVNSAIAEAEAAGAKPAVQEAAPQEEQAPPEPAAPQPEPVIETQQPEQPQVVDGQEVTSVAVPD